MYKRIYTLKDVQNYIKKDYCLDWKDFNIYDFKTKEIRKIQPDDFYGDGKTCFYGIGIFYDGTKKERLYLRFNNQEFSLGGRIQGLYDDYHWKYYLYHKHKKETENIKDLPNTNYNLKDIAEYLKIKYGLDWEDYLVLDYLSGNGNLNRQISQVDYYDDALYTRIVVKENGHYRFPNLYVDNDCFIIQDQETIAPFNSLQDLYWKDFYIKRHNRSEDKTI